MTVKISAAAFVRFLEERYKARDGYIMGATGQNPAKWAKTSWWFTQYKGTQRTQALRWRELARRVWDCNGLAEGYYQDQTGVNINTRARNNYSGWCSPKGRGTIPVNMRVPGAAVFKANALGVIHHVGYLVAPVASGKPGGDWYIIEAKGVAYGVVKTKLSDGGWNRWGHMTKYFDYAQAAPVEPTAPGIPHEPDKPYMCNWVVATMDCNIRNGPGTQYGKRSVALLKGTGLVFDGEIKNGWYAVWFYGARRWVSGQCAKIEVREKPIADISKYDSIRDFNAFAQQVSYVWVRAGARVGLSNGILRKDSKLDKHCAELAKRGVPYGVYFYGRAKTVAGAREEAAAVLKWAAKHSPTTVAYDIETATNTHEAVQAFVDAIEAAGIRCGIYVGRRWSQVKADKLRVAFRWGPYYRKNGGGSHGRNPTNTYDFHQYTCAYKFRGKADPGDVSHVHGPLTIEWLRSGEEVTKG